MSTKDFLDFQSSLKGKKKPLDSVQGTQDFVNFQNKDKLPPAPQTQGADIAGALKISHTAPFAAEPQFAGETIKQATPYDVAHTTTGYGQHQFSHLLDPAGYVRGKVDALTNAMEAQHGPLAGVSYSGYALNAVATGVESIVGGLDNFINKTGKFFDTFVGASTNPLTGIVTPAATPAQRAGAAIDMGVAGVMALTPEFAAGSAVLYAAKHSDINTKNLDKNSGAFGSGNASILGALSDGINGVFSKAGGTLGLFGTQLLDQVPDSVLSPQAKATLHQPIANLSGLVGLMFAAEALHGAGETVKNSLAFKTAAEASKPAMDMLGLETPSDKHFYTLDVINEAYTKQTDVVSQEFTNKKYSKTAYNIKLRILNAAKNILTDRITLKDSEFVKKWGQSQAYVSSLLPEARANALKNLVDAKSQVDMMRAVSARNVPIGNTEAGYRTVYDLSRRGKQIFALDAKNNLMNELAAINKTADGIFKTSFFSSVRQIYVDSPVRVDTEGNVSVEMVDFLNKIDDMETKGEYLNKETRSMLERRVLKEMVVSARTAFEDLTIKQKEEYRIATETDNTTRTKKIQSTINENAQSIFNEQTKVQAATNEALKKNPSATDEALKKKEAKAGKDIIAQGAFTGAVSPDATGATYTSRDIAQQDTAMNNLEKEDPGIIVRMATGKESIPDYLSPQRVLKHAENIVARTKNGNDTIELANSPLAEERSIHASELRLSQDRENVFDAIRKIDEERAQVFLSKKKGAAEYSKITEDVRNVIHNSARTITPDDILNFIKEISC